MKKTRRHKGTKFFLRVFMPLCSKFITSFSQLPAERYLQLCPLSDIVQIQCTEQD